MLLRLLPTMGSCSATPRVTTQTLVWSVVICTYHIISYHIISYHIISYHIISCRVMSCHVMSCHSMSYRIVSYRIISYHIIYISLSLSLPLLSRTMYIRYTIHVMPHIAQNRIRGMKPQPKVVRYETCVTEAWSVHETRTPDLRTLLPWAPVEPLYAWVHRDVRVYVSRCVCVCMCACVYV